MVDAYEKISGSDEDKFSRAGLTPVKGELVGAPFVKEFPLVLECKLLHSGGAQIPWCGKLQGNALSLGREV